MAEFDKIFETREQRCEFKIKKDLIHHAKGQITNFASPARARLDQIEQDAIRNHHLHAEGNMETENITQIRNTAYANDEIKMRVEKMKGRFDVMFSKKLPMDVKIKRFVGEPVVYHLHKNRFFLDKLTQKDKPDPPSTREILEKIRQETLEHEERVNQVIAESESMGY